MRNVGSDQEELALAISRGEVQANDAATRTGREAVEQGAQAMEEVLAKVYAEWQRLLGARSGRGARIARQPA